MLLKTITRNSHALVIERHSAKGIVLFSFGVLSAFVDPFKSVIYFADSGEYKTTKKHIVAWKREIADAAVLPGFKDFPVEQVQEYQLLNLLNAFLRTPEPS